MIKLIIMQKKELKDLLSNLLIDVNTLKPDIEKFKGNIKPALAENLIKIIEKLTPHSDLFEDSFKIRIKEYILTYEAAREGLKKGEKIFDLVKPTKYLICETLEDMYKDLD